MQTTDPKELHLLTLALMGVFHGELTLFQARVMIRDAGFPPHIWRMIAPLSTSELTLERETFAAELKRASGPARIIPDRAGNRKDLAAYLRANRRRWNLRRDKSREPFADERAYFAHCKHRPFIDEKDGSSHRVLRWFVSPF